MSYASERENDMMCQRPTLVREKNVYGVLTFCAYSERKTRYGVYKRPTLV